MKFRCKIGFHKFIIYKSPSKTIAACPDCGKTIESTR